MPDAEDGAEAEHADRLEVVGEEVGLPIAASKERGKSLLGDRGDEIVDIGRDDPRLVALIEAATQLKVPLAVHRHEGGTAE